MTEIAAFHGQCKITSPVTNPNSFVSIPNSGLAFVFVRLNQQKQTWDITSQPSGQGLRFQIGNLPYTGVDKGTGTVISTYDVNQDVQWYVSYRKAQNAYSIEAGYSRNQVWTVSNTSDPFSPIVVSTIEIIADEPPRYVASQLFKPVHCVGLD